MQIFNLCQMTTCFPIVTANHKKIEKKGLNVSDKLVLVL